MVHLPSPVCAPVWRSTAIEAGHAISEGRPGPSEVWTKKSPEAVPTKVAVLGPVLVSSPSDR